MSQLNSERLSLACDWQFRVEGDPSPAGVTGIPMGLSLNPGHFIESAFYNIMEPITTTGNPAVDTVRIFFWLDFFGVTLCLADTIANINALLLNRSEEHTSELQSRENLVCRLLLEKKNLA